MRKTRLFKVLTSAVLTGALVMSMGGMTAFANEKEMDLTKTVTTDGNTYAPVTTFDFSIANGEAGTKGTDVVYAGVDGGLTLLDSNNFAFGPTVEGMTATDAEYSVTGKIKADSSAFTVPGIYHYVLTETVPADEDKYEGIKYDSTEYDIYVYVELDSNNSLIVAAVVANAGGDDTVLDNAEGKSNGLTFTNDYGYDADNDSTHDVVITKAVAGNQGDKTKEFSFDVSVAGGEGEQYKVVKTTSAGSTESVLVSKAEAVVYTLKDGESIRIYGLSENDTYTVNEHDYSTDGYTTTNQNNTGTLTEDDTQITVTNTKNVTTPTGIALSFAPYILMVALAGVFAVLFLRRRREEF